VSDVSDVAMLVLSAGVGAIAGVVSTAWKSRKDLEAQYDIDLRERRIEAYSELWTLLEPLAYHFAPGPVTRGSARELGDSLRSWYFTKGGLVLSAGTRPAYFNLQQALEGTTDLPADHPGALEKRQLEILKALASRLRTSTTRDVATRIGSRLGPRLTASIERRWHRRFSPLRVMVDRRWRWDGGMPSPGVFVIVENAGDREVEIAGVEVPGAGDAVTEHGEAAFRLQPGEDRELSAPAPLADGPIAQEVTVEIKGRKALRSRATPPVPMQSHLMAGGQPRSQPK
jgi:hypothetical protein